VSYLPRYAGVPTTDLLNDFSPMILAKPKSHNFTWIYTSTESVYVAIHIQY